MAEFVDHSERYDGRTSGPTSFATGTQHVDDRLPPGTAEPVAMARIMDPGTVLLRGRRPPRVLELTENRQAPTWTRCVARALHAADVVGFIGRLVESPLEADTAPLVSGGFVAFSGDGSVLIDLG